MNRETEARFSNLPEINIKRSSFKRPFDHKTTFNASDLVPLYWEEVLPGDSVNMKIASLIRMQTPIFPVMDNAYADFYFFFVPNRIIWEHWKEFWGENNLTAWEQQVEYTIPQIEAPKDGWASGTIADYLGVVPGVEVSVSHLPFRAYCKIWNDWFRDENLKDPAMITTDETTVSGANTGDYVTYAEAGAKPLKVAKFHDRFTSALKAPQKGPSINLPLGGLAPVIGSDEVSGTSSNVWTTGVGKPLGIRRVYNTGDPQSDTVLVLANNINTAMSETSKKIGLAVDLSEAIGTTINEFRTALAIQAFYEAQARGGSRYVEFCKNIFGVTSPDGRLQRAEYLGGTRVQINMDQVLQTSETTETSPQGNTAAFSCTVDGGDIFTHSFTEHGILMGLMCVRTDHTYQQGIKNSFFRKKWTDFYIPQFANLGEQPVYNREIYAQGTDEDEQVFGYQESWSDYRYSINRVSGEMRSTYAQSLDYMHYGDDYEELPTLSSGWIDETEANIDRTIAVSHSTANQFFGDFYFDATWVRPMPVYSIPATLSHF